MKRRGASDMITKRMRTKYIIVCAVKTHVTLSSFVALMEPLGIYLVIVRTKVKLQYISLLSRSMNRANVDMDNVDVDSTSNASDDIFAVTASTDKLCEGPVSRFDARKVLLQQWILSKKRKLQANSWLKFFFRCCSILVLMTLIVVTVAVVTRLWSSRTFGTAAVFRVQYTTCSGLTSKTLFSVIISRLNSEQSWVSITTTSTQSNTRTTSSHIQARQN